MEKKGEQKARGEPRRTFAAQANTVKKFFQTVAIFATCIAATIVAALSGMAEAVAVLGVLSLPSGVLSFLWLIERKGWHFGGKSPKPAPMYAITAGLLLFALTASIAAPLKFGAQIGAASHLVVYGAEYLVAYSMRTRTLSRT